MCVQNDDQSILIVRYLQDKQDELAAFGHPHGSEKNEVLIAKVEEDLKNRHSGILIDRQKMLSIFEDMEKYVLAFEVLNDPHETLYNKPLKLRLVPEKIK